MLGLRKRQRGDNDQPRQPSSLIAASGVTEPLQRVDGTKDLTHSFSCRGCGQLPIVGKRHRSLRHGYGRGVNFCSDCLDGPLGPVLTEQHGPFKAYREVLSRSSSESRRELECPSGESLFRSLLGSDDDNLLVVILSQLDGRSLARLECTCQLFHVATSRLREGLSLPVHVAMRQVRARCAPASVRPPKQWTRLLASMLPRPVLVLRYLHHRPLLPLGQKAKMDANDIANGQFGSTGTHDVPRQHEDFLRSDTFVGPRPGYEFKLGTEGIGYYHNDKDETELCRYDCIMRRIFAIKEHKTRSEVFLTAVDLRDLRDTQQDIATRSNDSGLRFSQVGQGCDVSWRLVHVIGASSRLWSQIVQKGYPQIVSGTNWQQIPSTGVTVRPGDKLIFPSIEDPLSLR